MWAKANPCTPIQRQTTIMTSLRRTCTGYGMVLVWFEALLAWALMKTWRFLVPKLPFRLMPNSSIMNVTDLTDWIGTTQLYHHHNLIVIIINHHHQKQHHQNQKRRFWVPLIYLQDLASARQYVRVCPNGRDHKMCCMFNLKSSTSGLQRVRVAKAPQELRDAVFPRGWQDPRLTPHPPEETAGKAPTKA